MPFTKWVLPFYNSNMNLRLTIDSAGRVVIPKPLREELDLAPGDTLELETGGGSITLRPVRDLAPLGKEKGVWVFRTGQPMEPSTTADVLRQVRDERHRNNLGTEE